MLCPPPPGLILILNMHYLQYSCCIPISTWDFHVEGNRKLQWVFVFRSDCPKQWRIFLFSLGDWKGTHVTKHRLALCLISHFLYSSERVLTLKDVPSTLRSLVEVIAQHTNQKAKLKERKKEKKKGTYSEFLLFITSCYNHEVFLHCLVAFRTVSSKKRKSNFLICWKHYLRAIWKSGNGLGLSGWRGISGGI